MKRTSSYFGVIVATVMLFAADAYAQWQTPNRSIVVGRGPGVTGFRSVGPCLNTQILIWPNGISADPSCGNIGPAQGVAKVFTPEMYQGGCSVSDNTTALNAAGVAARAATGKIVLSNCIYAHSGTVDLGGNGVCVEGQGPGATILLFQPVANSTAINLGGTSERNYACLRNLTIYSNDATFTKTAIKACNVSNLNIKNVAITGSIAIGGTTYWSGGTGSIGLQLCGHEANSFEQMLIAADNPINFDSNPTLPCGDGDAFVFRDMYLFGNAGPIITVRSGVSLSNLTFEGRQNWIRGTTGFSFSDITVNACAGPYAWIFKNVRTEQGENAAAYSFDISPRVGLTTLVFDNVVADNARRGWRLRKSSFVNFNWTDYSSVSLEALNFDNTVHSACGQNTFWQTGSTATLSGQTGIIQYPQYPGNNVAGTHWCLKSSDEIDDTIIMGSNLQIRNSAKTLEVFTITAPSTPSSGIAEIYVDGTTKTLTNLNDAGIKSNTAIPITAVASNWLRSFNSSGIFTASRPICADLSNAGTGCSAAAGITALTGDMTATGPGSVTATLASVITAGGPIGSATITPIITYDAKGRLTTVSSTTITPAIGSITGLGTGVAAALAISIGSAGAPITFNGALGTPSTGTGTNITNVNAASLGGKVTGTSGNTIPLLDGTNTWSNQQTVNAQMVIASPTAGQGQNIQGNTTPTLAFVPSSGNTVQAAIRQTADRLDFQAKDVRNFVRWSLLAPDTPNISFVIDDNGNIIGGYDVRAIAALKNGVTTVGSLPTCNGSSEGSRYGVSDATALSAVFGTTLVGGSTVHTSAYCNGTAWIGG